MADAGPLSHDQLAEDLAHHLSGYSTPMVVWTDMQLGPSGSARPDVYTIEKTYTALRARVFEVKVSRSDFLSDVTSGKYLRYGAFAGSITFATPAGLVTKDEVPKGCGLITRQADGSWRYQRKPTLQRTPDLPAATWLKLVIDGCARHLAVKVVEATGPRTHNRWLHENRVRAKAGAELALALAARDRALHRLQEETDGADNLRARREAERQAELQQRDEQLKALEAEACAALGLKPESGWWQIRYELDERLKRGDLARVREALQTLDHTASQIEGHREALARLLPAGAAPADGASSHG